MQRKSEDNVEELEEGLEAKVGLCEMQHATAEEAQEAQEEAKNHETASEHWTFDHHKTLQ